MNTRSAIILLSGGLDSATVLALAQSQGVRCHTLAFDYGQRHRHELLSAARLSQILNAVSHKVLSVDLRSIGGSALTDQIDVPKNRSLSHISIGIPVTYVPARNLIFLSLATAYAEVLNVNEIHLGVNSIDYSGYPDCRPEFIQSFTHTANLATRLGVESSTSPSSPSGFTIHTPLISLSKAQIITLGSSLGLDYSLTHSCYDPILSPSHTQPPQHILACGRCDSCLLRKAGFRDAGIPDPTLYAPNK